jgi:uncharacterized membrane protein YphA (DoxX/SURF4 family)/thiol-disulfide isomerase/thioredoxin
MTTALVLARTILALVLLIAGAAKLASPSRTRLTLQDFGIPARLVAALAWLLPLSELGLGAALVPAVTARWAAAGALVLFSLFLAGILWNLSRGRRPDCGCFGQFHAAPIGRGLVIRNLGLGAMAGTIVALPAPLWDASLPVWLSGLTRGEGLALLLALAATGLAAVDAWLLSNLVRQNGRLLLRLDALEARLEDEMSSPAPLPPIARTEELRVGLPIGERAPEFALPDLDGTIVSLEDLRALGHRLLLLFMDPGCGPCLALMPQVARWKREFGEALTIAVLSRGTTEANRARIAGRDVGPVLLQAADEVAARYQARGTPAAVLVDGRGRVASPVAQGAGAIRRLVAAAPEQRALTAALSPQGAVLPSPALAGLILLIATTLLTAAATPRAPTNGSLTGSLEVYDGIGWRTWWRSDSAPEVWREPMPLIHGATSWKAVARGAEVGELVISGGSLALRTRIVLARFDPRWYRLELVTPPSQAPGGSTWTIDSANPGAVFAFNAGQFTESHAWGWLVRDGRELQAPSGGPLSMAVLVTSEGEHRFVSIETLDAVRRSGVAREALQSFPALLVEDGRVPWQLRGAGAAVKLGHRDIRLSLCALRDGRILVALTRFDNLGRVFGSLPIGLTLDETVAIMGALGCRRAVSLDGGLSAQLLARPHDGAVLRWAGNRRVPLGIEVRPVP